MPVIFPGFSWHNLMAARGKSAPSDAIPRLDGRFLWRQAAERIRQGADMLYVAMFDELDEGTAIMPTSARVPVGPSRFVTEPGLPADHYLWLTGRIGAALRKEIPAPPDPPSR
jgi:hypothetical protein